MEDFSTSSEFSFVKNLMPRLYAANPAYKTNKAKLMHDMRILRTFLGGKIPCLTANDTEQLSILISRVSSDGDETHATKSTIQTKSEFDSSDVSPIKSEVMEENSDKVPPSFSQGHSRKNRTKKSKHSSHKKAKTTRRQREYSSDSSNSSSEEDTRHTPRHSEGPFPYFNPLCSFRGQPQGYPNPMPFFYQPLQPYLQTSGIQQGFQLANSENNFVQNTNLYNTLPFEGRKVGSKSTSTVTSTTKSSVSSLNQSLQL